ncbi:MAG TPA: TolC family protein [Bacteroidales bacterium]|jgi:outer membrane protein|nr:TolC family protein [Bacteroidales bacterium]HQK70189.1 TolC family protein [Bacteroidales bacterium]
MKKILILLIVLFSLPPGQVLPQEKIWTLEECIQYAIDNNIQIKQQVLQTRFQENTLNQSKLKLLPSINGQAAHNFSFNRTLDQTTYQYVDQNGQSNQFYLGGNMDIFNGLQNYNTIRKNKYQLISSELDLESLKNNISLNIALAFLQILLNSELVNTTDNQLQITHQQIEKTKRMFEAGSVARGNLLQIEAQAASEELQLINLRNQLEISYLNLTQMLELQSPEGFRILTPEIRIDTSVVFWGNVTDIYNEALGIRPEIKSAEMNLAARELELKIARGARSPRISMNHSMSTMYSNIRKKIIGIDPGQGMLYGDYPFSEQLSDNLNYGFGFTLTMPILNGWQVNTNISGSKLNIENSQYTLEAEKKQLYKTIQQSWADAVAALKKYSASMKAVASMEESFRYTEQKFNVGMVTPVDYNAAKTQLLTAQSEMAQSKYEFIFKTKVLDFYKGIPLNLNQ